MLATTVSLWLTLSRCYPVVTQYPREDEMPKLTAISVQAYRPKAKRLEIPDTGCTGLYLIVQPSGKKSWAMRFRRPDGRPAKMMLGRADDGVEPDSESTEGTPLTVLQAHELVAKIARERARGVDVIENRKTEKLRKLN